MSLSVGLVRFACAMSIFVVICLSKCDDRHGKLQLLDSHCFHLPIADRKYKIVFDYVGNCLQKPYLNKLRHRACPSVEYIFVLGLTNY